MHSKSVSRRVLLGSSAAVLCSAAGLIRPTHAQGLAAAIRAGLGTLDSSIAALLTGNLDEAKAKLAGLAHGGLVRRIVNPALRLDFVSNPHRRPVGNALSKAEQAAFRARAAAAGAVSGASL